MKDRRIHQIILNMEINLCQSVSLEVTARTVNLSSSRLRHLFKAETGSTPTQYLKSLRMRRAKHLLEASYLRVKEICHLVGINSQSRFVRDFKLSYGETPARYRASYNDMRPPDNLHTKENAASSGYE